VFASLAPAKVSVSASAKKRRLAYVADGYSEWQIVRAESLRQSAGLGDDEEFPAHVYPAARVCTLVERPVAPAMADLALPSHYLERPFRSQSVPGVTVVLPELDDPASYPRRFAQLPPVEPFTRYASTGVGVVSGWSTLDPGAAGYDPSVALTRAAQ
jgi:hypothetical protein